MLMGEESFRDFIKTVSYSFQVRVVIFTVTMEPENIERHPVGSLVFNSYIFLMPLCENSTVPS